MAANKDRLRSSNAFMRRGETAPTLYDLTESMIEDAPEVAIPEGALVPVGDGSYMLGRARITPTGLDLPADTTIEEWEQISTRIATLESATQWAIGDLLAFAEDREWCETYRQFAERFELQIDTLYSYSSVCRNVLIRNQELSFAHHRLVAGMGNQHDQEVWLRRAVQSAWTVSQMRDAINNANRPALSTKGNTVADSSYGKSVKNIAKFVSGGGGKISQTKITQLEDDVRILEGLLSSAKRELRKAANRHKES